jgi:hypothetical protein
MPEYPELDRLLSRYLDGSVTADELALLESQLGTDEQFAEHVARWCLAHRQVSELLTENKLHRLMDQFVATAPGLPKETVKQLRESSTAVARDRSGRSDSGRFRSLSWAAFAMGVAIGAAWLFANRSQNVPSESKQTATAQADPVSDSSASKVAATLTQVVDAVWAKGATALHHGQLLRVGDHVALQSGMVKVTFDCGAEVVLQGPCDFWIHAPMEGHLLSGRITANVPRRAFSFAILSPQVDMVDLGTSFGVEVGDHGRTELHVFEGEVLCSEPAKQQTGKRNEIIHVTANNAMEFRAAAGEPSDIAMNQAQFAGLIALRRAADVKAGHLTEDKLALWLAADVAVTTDAANRVIAWQDIVYGDNRSGEDAIQVDEQARPLLVDDAIHGHPGIRFDGESDYLLTTPLETTDDQTVLFVCQFGPQTFRPGRKWGGQIINYDGPPSRYLSDTSQPGVLQIGEPLLEEEFRPSLLTGQVFAGFIGSATVESGRVDAASFRMNEPVIVSYVYDYEYERGMAYLMINGRKYGEARAFAPQWITSRKIVGRHAWMELYFGGDLAEMLIFNKALTPDELTQTTTYLADKYAIPLDE